MITVTVLPLIVAALLGIVYAFVVCWKPKPKLSMKELRSLYLVPDLLADAFGSKEVDEYRRTFSYYDKDGSGSIDIDEMGLACKEFNRKLKPEDIRVMVLAVDVNNDGQVDFGEFLYVSCYR